ncbi:MFS transporter [Kribbella sp. NPDC051587]|uniref:MFS transporter n=1 Tax=Kribbella sp. NPDC051587 TaxID=3364119 RepID=UPI0037A2743A
MTILQRARALVPPPGGSRQLVIATLFVSLGFAVYSAASVLYFNRVVGLSTTQVGVALTAAGLVGVPMRIYFGTLADRFGPREVTVVFELLLGCALVGLCFVHSYPAVIVALCLISITENGANVVFGALTAGVAGPERRVEVSAYMRSYFNGGFAAGGILAGVLLSLDSRAAYLAAMAGYGVLRIVIGLGRLMLPRLPRNAKPRAGGTLSVLKDVPYFVLGQVVSVYTLCDKILLIGLPLWIVNQTGAPTALMAILLTGSTLIITLFQVRFTRNADSIDGSAKLQRLALVALAVTCGLLAVSWHRSPVQATILLSLAVVALSIGEMWGAGAAWGLRFELADQEAQGAYSGVFTLGSVLPNVLGPLLVTAGIAYLAWGGWIVMAGLFLLFAVVGGPVVRWTVRTRLEHTGRAIETTGQGVEA